MGVGTDRAVLGDSTTEINEKASVTLGEAAARLGLNRSALRRRLKAGKIPGAWQTTGPNGTEWRVPIAALEKLGYRLAEKDGPVGNEGHSDSGNGRASDLAKLGIITRYFNDALKRERAKLLEAEEARIKLATSSEAGRAEAMRLRAELDKKIGALSAAERSRRATALEREAAHIESLLFKSQLGTERARREQAEQDKLRAVLAAAEARAAEARAAERAARPTWWRMLRMRVAWTLIGSAVTLGALVLVASLLLDFLFKDGMTDEQPYPRRVITGGPAPAPGGPLDASDASATTTLQVAVWKGPAESSSSKDAPKVDRVSGRSKSHVGDPGGNGGGSDDDTGDGGHNPGGGNDPRAGAADQPSAPRGSKGTTGGGSDTVDIVSNTTDSVGERVGSAANTAGDLVETATDSIGGVLGEPAGTAVASTGGAAKGTAKAAARPVEDATGAVEDAIEGAVDGLLP